MRRAIAFHRSDSPGRAAISARPMIVARAYGGVSEAIERQTRDSRSKWGTNRALSLITSQNAPSAASHSNQRGTTYGAPSGRVVARRASRGRLKNSRCSAGVSGPGTTPDLSVAGRWELFLRVMTRRLLLADEPVAARAAYFRLPWFTTLALESLSWARFFRAGDGRKRNGI